jgi:glycosyltransferase involved in cell wall biosynthesis
MTGHGDIFDRPPGTYSRELTWFYKRVTPRAYRRSDFVQALSPYMAEWAVRGGAHPERVRIIPNGIDPQEIGAGALAPRSPDSFVPEGTLRLLYVGSLWNLKAAHGAESDAARALSFQKISVTLIGDGTLRRKLEALVAMLGLVDEVDFLGRVPRGQLAGHYQQADILCVPSISEALSVVTLEAMCCGLPIAGSQTGGIPFLVEHGLSGYLARPGDEEGLAAAIARAASSRTHLAELGGRGYLKAHKSFGWPDIVEQLNALLRDTLALKSDQAGNR